MCIGYPSFVVLRGPPRPGGNELEFAGPVLWLVIVGAANGSPGFLRQHQDMAKCSCCFSHNMKSAFPGADADSV